MEDKNRKVIKSIVMVTQISISMMVPIFLCAALGVWLDRLFNTQVCFLVLVFIGIGASFRNLYILTKSLELKDYKDSHPGEAQEYTEIVKTKRYPENKGPARK